jgi:hypothetical protein
MPPTITTPDRTGPTTAQAPAQVPAIPDLPDVRLTAKQERFARLVAAGFAQSDAYRQAYDVRSGSAHIVAVEASRLANAPDIALTIESLRAIASAQATHGFAVSRARVIAEMYRMATYDPRQLLGADGRPLPLHELPDEIASAVEQVDVLVDAEGRPTAFRYKLARKAAHLEQTAKALGMFEEDNRQRSASLASALAQLAGTPAPRIGPASE